jgi:hypothetical protein
MKSTLEDFCFPSSQHLASQAFIARVSTLADLFACHGRCRHPIAAASAPVECSHSLSERPYPEIRLPNVALENPFKSDSFQTA